MGGTLRKQQRVVPGVAYLLLSGAGGTLDNQGGIAVYCCGEVLRQPGFRSARLAYQQEGAVGDEGRNAYLNDTAVAMYFGVMTVLPDLPPIM